MASLSVVRNALNAFRRVPAVLASRSYSDVPHVVPHRGKTETEKSDMPDGLGHSVGVDRFERLASVVTDDPFEMTVKKTKTGTRDDPTLISSIYDERCVGCICEEDALSINWMVLNKGEAKRCMCGYWFQLAEVKPHDYGQ